MRGPAADFNSVIAEPKKFVSLSPYIYSPVDEMKLRNQEGYAPVLVPEMYPNNWLDLFDQNISISMIVCSEYGCENMASKGS